MPVIIIDPPYALVTLEEAKVACGDSGDTYRDELISGLIMAAQSELDGPNGVLGISVAQQTVEVRYDDFTDPIKLPGGPVVSGSVVVTYLDADGVTQTIEDTEYVLSTDGTISLAAGGSWPTPVDQAEAVSIQYTVGIQGSYDPRIEQMKSAIKLHVKKSLDMVDPDIYERAIRALTASLRVMTV